MIPIPSPDFPAYLLRSHHLQFLLYLLLSFVLHSNIYLIYLIFHLSFSLATGGKPNSSERPDMSYFAFQSFLRWTGGWRHDSSADRSQQDLRKIQRKLSKDSGNFLKNTRNKQKWDRVGAVLTPPLLFWPGIGWVRRVPG